MKKPLFKPVTLIILTFLILFSCLSPIYPEQMFLQHAATLVIIGLLIYDIKIDFLSKEAFLGIVLFLLLHAIGARYIYSYVPYNEWSQYFLGININETFEWERNHYDRIVHFLFGVFLYPFTYEVALKKFKINTKAAFFMAWLMIQTFSMLYEIFEWLLTVFLSGDQAENYNGQQGDPWDAHKDMALALLGSTITMVVLLFKNKVKK